MKTLNLTAPEIEKAGKWLETHSRIEELTIVINVLVFDSNPFEAPGFLVEIFESALDKFIDEHKIQFVYGWLDKSNTRILYATQFGELCCDFRKATPTEPVSCHKDNLIFRPRDEFEYKSLIAQASGSITSI